MSRTSEPPSVAASEGLLALTSKTLDEESYTAGVEELYASARLPLVAQLVNGAAVLYGLWQTGGPNRTAVVWFSVMSTVVLLRLGAFWKHTGRPLRAEEAPRLAHLFTAGAGLSGLVWGATALLLFPVHQMEGQVLLTFVVGGMTAGAAASYTGYAPAFYAFSVPSLLPLGLRLLGDPTPAPRAMGLMTFLFFGVLSNVNRRGSRAVEDTRRLRISNTQLLERISVTQHRLEELNRGLEDRVQLRTAEIEASTGELARSGYLARLGGLAAGLAHEINNPLAYVTSNLSFLNRTLGELNPMAETQRRELLEVIAEALEGAERVRTTVGHLKAMAQRDDDTVGAVDLHAVLESCMAVGRSELRKRAHLTRTFGEVPRVEGKRGQLSQVFLTLLFHAADGLLEEKLSSNRIELRTGLSRDGSRVEVHIEDNGPGLPHPNVPQGEPLGGALGSLSTGGLGLAMCQSLIGDLGGSLEISSVPGIGTTCVVGLRIAQ